mmetsp:Transcript_37685/g.95254  ORF Transcript_37685/g.95254 Transcript_37685/m.95254 type:complete len:202 (-) Transcript_37685:830-1435(-)
MLTSLVQGPQAVEVVAAVQAMVVRLTLTRTARPPSSCGQRPGRSSRSIPTCSTGTPFFATAAARCRWWACATGAGTARATTRPSRPPCRASTCAPSATPPCARTRTAWPIGRTPRTCGARTRCAPTCRTWSGATCRTTGSCWCGSTAGPRCTPRCTPRTCTSWPSCTSTRTRAARPSPRNRWCPCWPPALRLSTGSRSCRP